MPQTCATPSVVAPMIRVNNFDELEAKKKELKGKIVFYNNPFDDTLINPFSAYGKNVVYRSDGVNDFTHHRRCAGTRCREIRFLFDFH